MAAFLIAAVLFASVHANSTITPLSDTVTGALNTSVATTILPSTTGPLSAASSTTNALTPPPPPASTAAASANTTTASTATSSTAASTAASTASFTSNPVNTTTASTAPTIITATTTTTAAAVATGSTTRTTTPRTTTTTLLSLWSLLQAQPLNYSSISVLLGATSVLLQNTKRLPGDWTVLAPTDDAFAALPPNTLDNLLNDIPSLTRFLSYHMLPKRVFSANLVEGSSLATLLAGANVTAHIINGQLTLDSATVLRADTLASNGVLYTLNSVLNVPALTTTAAPTSTATLGPIFLNLVQVMLRLPGNFSTITSAIDVTNLTAALQSPGPFTVFAPSNAAFDALGEDVALELFNDTLKLQSLLKYHVAMGGFGFNDLRPGRTLLMSDGGRAQITGNSSGVQINGVPVIQSRVFPATNGFVYMLPGVMALPPQPFTPTPTTSTSTTTTPTSTITMTTTTTTTTLTSPQPTTITTTVASSKTTTSTSPSTAPSTSSATTTTTLPTPEKTVASSSTVKPTLATATTTTTTTTTTMIKTTATLATTTTTTTRTHSLATTDQSAASARSASKTGQDLGIGAGIAIFLAVLVIGVIRFRTSRHQRRLKAIAAKSTVALQSFSNPAFRGVAFVDEIPAVSASSTSAFQETPVALPNMAESAFSSSRLELETTAGPDHHNVIYDILMPGPDESAIPRESHV